MADYSLGTAQGRIVLDYDSKGIAQANSDVKSFGDSSGRLGTQLGKYSKDADNASKATKDLGRSMSSQTQSLQGLATGVGVVGAVIAVGLGYAAKTAIDFEKQISAIGAVSGATEKDLESLRQKALELGSSTSFSASEAGLAMEELAKAGIPLKDILNGAADAAVALAAAGGTELATAAELAANAMNAFGIKATEMGGVADLIAGAANASAISVEEFGISLQQVGAVANLAGATFEDTAVAIALMGQAGIKGSDAGTSLKTMLQNLNPSTKKATTLMKDLGIITADGSNKFFDAQGNLKSLGEVSGTLQEALKGQTKQQKLATLGMLFGSDAIRAAAILAEGGAEGFTNMADAMGKVTAESVAAARLDNVAGAIEQLKGSLETAAINIGTLFLPAIKLVANFITKMANSFSQLDPKWQKFIAFGAAAVAGLLLFVAAALGVAAAVTAIIAAVGGGAIAAWVAGIAAAVFALGAAFSVAYAKSETFRDVVNGAIGAVVDFVQTTLVPIFRETFKFLAEVVDIAKRAIVEAFKGMQPAFEAAGKFIQDISPKAKELGVALLGLAKWLHGVAKPVIGLLVPAFRILGKVIGFLAPIFLQVAGTIAGVLITALTWLISNIPKIVGSFGFLTTGVVKFSSAIVSGLATAFNVVRGVISGFLSWVVKAWNSSWSAVVSFTKAVGAGITSTFRNALNFVTSLITRTISVIKSMWQSGLNGMRSIASSVWSAIRSVVRDGVNGVRSAVARVSEIAGMVRGYFNQMKSAVSSGISSVVSTVRELPGRVRSALGSLGNILFSAGQDIVRGLLNGISSMAGAVIGKARDLANSVRGAISGALKISSPSKVTFEIGGFVSEGLANGILSGARKAINAARSLSAGVISAVPIPTGAINTPLNTGVARAQQMASSTVVNQTVNQTINAPQNMDAGEVATLASRRLLIGLSTVTPKTA